MGLVVMLVCVALCDVVGGYSGLVFWCSAGFCSFARFRGLGLAGFPSFLWVGTI